MNYKGIAIPVQRPDGNEGIIYENKIIESVSFEPFEVTFEDGVKLPWSYTKEQFDVFIESVQSPRIEDALTEYFKSKQIMIGYKWRKITGFDMESSAVSMIWDDKEVTYFLSDLYRYRLKDDLDNSKS